MHVCVCMYMVINIIYTQYMYRMGCDLDRYYEIWASICSQHSEMLIDNVICLSGRIAKTLPEWGCNLDISLDRRHDII